MRNDNDFQILLGGPVKCFCKPFVLGVVQTHAVYAYYAQIPIVVFIPIAFAFGFRVFGLLYFPTGYIFFKIYVVFLVVRQGAPSILAGVCVMVAYDVQSFCKIVPEGKFAGLEIPDSVSQVYCVVYIFLMFIIEISYLN